MPARLTKVYILAITALLLFLCTVQLFRHSPNTRTSAGAGGWREWMWPQYPGQPGLEPPTTVKGPPPKFERPPEEPVPGVAVPLNPPPVKSEPEIAKGGLAAGLGKEVQPPKGEMETMRWAEGDKAAKATATSVASAPAETSDAEKSESSEEAEKKEEEEHEDPSRKAWHADALSALNTTFHVPADIHYKMTGPDPSQVVIVTATDGKGHNGGIEDIVGQTAANRKAYCEFHGYNYHFVNISKFSLPDAHPVWKKIPAIVDAFNTFPHAQWVFFLDLDAIIMSPKQDLNSLILSHAGMGKNLEFGQEFHGSEWTPLGVYMPKKEDVRFDDLDLLVAQDHNGINAGSFFLRRSRFTQWMLDMWADPFFMKMDWPGQEQDTLLHFVKHHKVFRQHVGLIKQRVANAYTEGNDNMKWMPGDLIIHFAGCWVNDECQERWQEFWKKRQTLSTESA